MSARKKKSKKQFDTRPGWPREPIIFFVDYCLGFRIVEVLRDAGLTVEAHRDHFKEDAPDVEWLTQVGARGWVVLTKDKGMRRKPVELQTITAAKLRVFNLAGGNMTGEEMRDVFLANLDRMGRILNRHKAPFIASVSRSGVRLLWSHE